MIDMKLVREKPDVLNASLKARGLDEMAEELQALDLIWRKCSDTLQQLLAERNEIAKNIGKAKSEGMDASALMQRADEIKAQLPELEEQMRHSQAQLEERILLLPNVLAEDTPIGTDEKGNVIQRQVGVKPTFAFTPKEHHILGEELGLLDFSRTANMSGARFSTLSGDLARLEMALANFMLDCHRAKGYTQITPPVMVRDKALLGSGQLPKFAEDLFQTTDGYYLIPTSEVPLCNIMADRIVPEEMLPMRFTSYSLCFRSEAGSAGRDTKGMIRQHQFSKVEMVSITNIHDSMEELERMTNAACDVLDKLELPYQVVRLCSGDIGFSSHKTYDIEVWLPGQNAYREISSCSTCGDFQARRLQARYKSLQDKKNYYVHTLNGSGLAIGRTIVAIMENYQNADGTINVPKVLQPYLGGQIIITKAKQNIWE